MCVSVCLSLRLYGRMWSEFVSLLNLLTVTILSRVRTFTNQTNSVEEWESFRGFQYIFFTPIGGLMYANKHE